MLGVWLFLGLWIQCRGPALSGPGTEIQFVFQKTGAPVWNRVNLKELVSIK